MRHLKIGLATLLVLAPLEPAAEVIQARERTYAVTYKDGAVERYTVKWLGNVNTALKDEGNSPVPYQGSVDNPRCTWTINSNIERSVSLVTRLGQPFPLPGMSKTFDRDPQSPGTAFLASGTRNERCNDSRRAREEEIEGAKRAFLQTFDRITKADLEGLGNEARKNADVVSITVQ